MKTTRFLLAFLLVIMGVGIAWALVAGNFRVEGAGIWEMAWGKLTLLDLYAGFAIFSGWIVFREAKLSRSIPWIVAVMLLGNFASCLYALVALTGSGGASRKFWMGNRCHDA